MLKIENLQLRYQSDTCIDFPDWAVDKQQHAIILGKSGSGKTTLLHILAGILSPTAGTVQMNNTNISSLKDKELDQFRKQHIGIIFQKPHLVTALTVSENLLLAQQLSGAKADSSLVNSLLEELDISQIANRKTHEISQGQAQRVAIARAIIKQPDLLIADEPTASLDDENCEKVVNLLKNQAEKNESTLIIATHDQRVTPHFQNILQL